MYTQFELKGVLGSSRSKDILSSELDVDYIF